MTEYGAGPRSITARAMAAFTAALVLASCDINFFVCDELDRQALLELPSKLSETGLYADIATGEIAGDVIAYRPQFELWSDGAEKRRWFRLPAGTQIETSNQSDWQFPIGTLVFKEFASQTQELETRLLKRVGPGNRDWLGVSYVWQPGGSDALARVDGALAVGLLPSENSSATTEHNVPAASECAACHGGRASYILGLSAVSLAYEAEAETLSDLVARGLLTDPPSSMLEVPGDPVQRRALGYLHANCAHCHNADRPPRVGARCFEPKNELDFLLRPDELGNVEDTGTYRTAFEDALVRGAPDASDLIDRVSKRGFIYQMPPLGTEAIDREAVTLLRRWVSEL